MDRLPWTYFFAALVLLMLSLAPLVGRGEEIRMSNPKEPNKRSGFLAVPPGDVLLPASLGLFWLPEPDCRMLGMSRLPMGAEFALPRAIIGGLPSGWEIAPFTIGETLEVVP